MLSPFSLNRRTSFNLCLVSTAGTLFPSINDMLHKTNDLVMYTCRCKHGLYLSVGSTPIFMVLMLSHCFVYIDALDIYGINVITRLCIY